MGREDYTRHDILSTIDYIIEKIQNLRKVMLGVSISTLVLAPFAIGISAYLLTHPSFFVILENKDEFGVFLSILLGAIIVISVVWLIVGIRQYHSLSVWKNRYPSYQQQKDKLDESIIKDYHLDEKS